MASTILLLCIAATFDIFTRATAGHAHPVPTYFGKLDENGKLIDRNSPEYNNEIESKRWINKISRSDADSIKLQASPATVRNGEKITITWSGVNKPGDKDFIACYCPYYDHYGHYIDWFWTKSVKGWEAGEGHTDKPIYNLRAPCVFKLYRLSNDNNAYVLAAISNLVHFADGGPYAPLHGHIAMTNDPSEMRVMWTSAEVTRPPVVRYGRSEELRLVEHAHLTHTYSADSMCQSPANGRGFHHPGTTYDFLLTNLTPNTLYYYSYGTSGYMSIVANFTTPIPAGEKTPYKFIIYGDQGVSPWYPAGDATAKNVRKEVDQNNIRFVFHHGDVSYARGWAYIWDQWFSLVEPYATLVPYMVGIGNHEYDHTAGGIGRDPSNIETDGGWKPSWFNGKTDSGGECGVPMHNRFHMPANGNGLFWYSYDYGMVHMIMMSTEHDFSPGSKQYKWLEMDLATVDRKVTPWVIIAGHRAMYASNKAYSDFVVAKYMQKLFEELLYRYKVDMAFWAHYHSYERTCKVYQAECVDDGIVHVVVGSAGCTKDPDHWYNVKWSVFRKSEYGYGRVTVANSSALLYEWVQNSDGLVKDDVWLHK